MIADLIPTGIPLEAAFKYGNTVSVSRDSDG